ncbi:hypothetical protein [Deinococcus apachensis]|uniref:hypothetical protein n=1 Tax=Deinococcus apachensis TaxID=309886 RepID=UPI0003815CE5|nr:hypothetical protein [Deinococcus apachensis]
MSQPPDLSQLLERAQALQREMQRLKAESQHLVETSSRLIRNRNQWTGAHFSEHVELANTLAKQREQHKDLLELVERTSPSEK